MLKVFLSYAVEDRALVDPYFERLADAGFDPWMDHRKILPGQNWSLEIDRAFSAAHVIMIFLSPRSVNKRGFVQREANDAIERLRQKLPDDIYIIPLLLEPCQVPRHISDRIQYHDLRPENAWDVVLKSLRLAAEQQQIELVEGVQAGSFRVYTETLTESRSESPKFEILVEVPRFESSKFPQKAIELNKLFNGYSIDQLIEFRSDAWINAREREGWNDFGSDFDSRFGIAFSNEKVLSIWSTQSSYFAGTAHGNAEYRTYNFAFEPDLIKLDLLSFFSNRSAGLEKFSELCISGIVREYSERSGGQVDEDAMEYIRSGAGPVLENFEAFTFDETKITVLFSAYQVAPYAMGHWAIDVKYSDLAGVLATDGPHAETGK